MKKLLLTTITVTQLFSNYINYGTVNILDTRDRFVPPKKLPIRFIDSKDEKPLEREDETIFEDNDIEESRVTSSDYFYFEFGIRYLNDLFLDVSDELSGFTISRNIEFYDQSSFSPYFRLNFRDIEIIRRGDIFFRNSLEADYISHTQQVPFYHDTGQFPYGRGYDIGTEVTAISLFWRGSLFYKADFFSVGTYIGAGMNMMSGKASYLRYAPSDINGSLSSNLGHFNDGRVLELGETITLDMTSSILTKYGLEINFDFLPFHLGFGIDYGITSEINLYWFERAYFMELSYIF